MLKVSVFGNRNITDKEKIWEKYIEYLDHYLYDIDKTVFIHGGATGPQELIKKLYEQYLTSTIVLFKPWHMLWGKLEFNPIFFYLRNKQIVENADKVIVFTNGEKDSEVYRVIDLCERRGKDLTIIEM